MTSSFSFIGVVSVIVLVLLLLSEFLMPRRFRLLQIVALVIVLAVAAIELVAFFAPSAIETKGDSSRIQWVMTGLMYLAMIVGIIAQSYYFSADGARADWTGWIKPALASPIIFIPLLSSYQSALANIGDVSITDLMILLVSFQNGFFWKVVFDKQAEAISRRATA